MENVYGRIAIAFDPLWRRLPYMVRPQSWTAKHDLGYEHTSYTIAMYIVSDGYPAASNSAMNASSDFMSGSDAWKSCPYEFNAPVLSGDTGETLTSIIPRQRSSIAPYDANVFVIFSSGISSS